MSNYTERLRNTAVLLATLNSHDPDVMRPVGFLVGACYALRMSLQFGWQDGSEKRADIDPKNYLAEMLRVARWLAETDDLRGAVAPEIQEPTNRWSAGFYYTNALMRISAAAECLEVHPSSGSETEATKAVRRTVNVLKHSLAAGSGVRVPAMAMTLQALEDVLATCKERGLIGQERSDAR